MTTYSINRRDLLGTTATGLAALAALSGMPGSASAFTGAFRPARCIANHTQLAENLAALVADPSISDHEKAHALKTCRCVHCDVAVAPLV